MSKRHDRLHFLERLLTVFYTIIIVMIVLKL